ncbi:MAG: sigma-70 family RNA polymerase sigma factor [Planctomycetia bacterium]|nr:sigma-70 family RNA polymerase sigma factor [Planctomycetia bacterium]
MDVEQLQRLVDQQAAALELFASQWCDVPQDVVQEAFIELARVSTPPERVIPWLYSVVRNRSISAVRRTVRRRKHEARAAAEHDGWFEAASDVRLDAQAAAVHLRSLPIEQREPIVLHIWGGLTFEQIAELIQTSSSTAHRRYLAGLATLRERLQQPCPKKNPNVTSISA